MVQSISSDEPKQKLDSLKQQAREPEARRGWYSGHSLQFSALLTKLPEMFDRERRSSNYCFSNRW
jgi:hypothetical protein